MVSREILTREHAELDALALRLLAMIDGAGPVEGLSALRWRLNYVLMVHLAKEDRLLYPAMIAEPATARVARRFASEMGNLAETFLAYNAAWPVERIEADWAGFGAATRAVMVALRIRILREERDLFSRISGYPVTSASIAPCRM